MTDDDTVAQLAAAVPHYGHCLALRPPVGTTLARTGSCTCAAHRIHAARVLQPVVDAIAEERARQRLAAVEALVAEYEGPAEAWSRPMDAHSQMRRIRAALNGEENTRAPGV